MTISYSDSFGALLLQWKGSLYKAVMWDMLAFYALYYIIFFIQYFALDDQQQASFSKMIDYFDKGTNYIPLTFLLGFYVAGIVARWWEQFNWISWPDKLMMVVSMCLPGDENRKARRLIARWANLEAAIAWRGISLRTIKRFPTMEHIVASGLMTEHEHEVFENTVAPHGKYFLPLVWITNLLRKKHQKGQLDSVCLKIITKQLLCYRDGFAMLYVYDWIKTPLVYTQVVAIATYGYFMFCLIARQPKIDAKSREEEFSIYFPIFTTLQMLFYMGWLKVGQYLANPFGEDDDDFGDEIISPPENSIRIQDLNGFNTNLHLLRMAYALKIGAEMPPKRSVSEEPKEHQEEEEHGDESPPLKRQRKVMNK